MPPTGHRMAQKAENIGLGYCFSVATNKPSPGHYRRPEGVFIIFRRELLIGRGWVVNRYAAMLDITHGKYPCSRD
jgi:hypothetical protein